MAILFDLDGVFYQGDQALPGAVEVGRWVRDENIPHLFLTNTTSRPRQALVDKLAGIGIETRNPRILTPAVVASNWCQKHIPGGAVALFVPEATRAEFDGLPQSDCAGEIAAVIVGDLGEAWDFHRLNLAFGYLMAAQRPQLIALGMTRYWQAPEGLRLDVAPFVMALSHAAGVQPLVTGKPDRAFFEAALSILDATPEETVMIGDDIRGDIEGAQSAGLRGVLVRTGKFREVDLAQGIRPDALLGSLEELPSWYRENGLPL